MPNQPDDISRPITLFVEDVNTTPELAYTKSKRVTVIDIELDCAASETLVKYLTERLCDDTNGAIRIRLSGRLVIA